ncbi:hypothetical protein [Singulisphaera sp. PoT]|uniref:hypothetical protein n=1 Tax=Singulisphaera sp. PoT TaxID=3411797 RepID=UPI003BF489DD
MSTLGMTLRSRPEGWEPSPAELEEIEETKRQIRRENLGRSVGRARPHGVAGAGEAPRYEKRIYTMHFRIEEGANVFCIDDR